MRRATVKTIYEDTGKRRALVFQRDDGTFGFDEEHFSDDSWEQCWVPSGLHSECRCDSLEIAIREMTDRVDWLRK
jgi:hypothetical protein